MWVFEHTHIYETFLAHIILCMEHIKENWLQGRAQLGENPLKNNKRMKLSNNISLITNPNSHVMNLGLILLKKLGLSLLFLIKEFDSIFALLVLSETLY